MDCRVPIKRREGKQAGKSVKKDPYGKELVAIPSSLAGSSCCVAKQGSFCPQPQMGSTSYKSFTVHSINVHLLKHAILCIAMCSTVHSINKLHSPTSVLLGSAGDPFFAPTPCWILKSMD